MNDVLGLGLSAVAGAASGWLLVTTTLALLRPLKGLTGRQTWLLFHADLLHLPPRQWVREMTPEAALRLGLDEYLRLRASEQEIITDRTIQAMRERLAIDASMTMFTAHMPHPQQKSEWLN